MRTIFCVLISATALLVPTVSSIGAGIEVGLAVRDVTPDGPIFLAGYASRRKPSESIDTRLKTQALAIRSGGAPFVFVSLDNCEVSRKFMEPVVSTLEQDHGLPIGSVMVVSSHTHSGPVLDDTLEVMAIMPEKDREIIRQYSARLRQELIEVVVEATQRFQPARLEHGVGEATFAMNRRVYRSDGVKFGENPNGPVNWDVPVLRITDEHGKLLCVLFGYACHGTSVQGEGFFAVSGDYMAYTREHLESVYPGTIAMYVTGMGADINPSPRGSLMDAKRHGVELAGAVIEVMNKPMRTVDGDLEYRFDELEIEFEPAPDRAQLETDAESENIYVRRRAQKFLRILDDSGEIPQFVSLPMSAVRVGNDLTFVNIAGEVVVDYSIQLKRLFKDHHPWMIGYAYEVPCYIPSIRILKEGGYEAEASMIYYGFYGPFTTEIEPIIIDSMTSLMEAIY